MSNFFWNLSEIFFWNIDDLKYMNLLNDQCDVIKAKKQKSEQEHEPTIIHNLAASQLVKNTHNIFLKCSYHWYLNYPCAIKSKSPIQLQNWFHERFHTQ